MSINGLNSSCCAESPDYQVVKSGGMEKPFETNSGKSMAQFIQVSSEISQLSIKHINTKMESCLQFEPAGLNGLL